MKVFGFVSGLAVGMAAATAATMAMYPELGRRMKRDTKRLMHSCKKML